MNDTSGAMGARLVEWRWHIPGRAELNGSDLEVVFTATGDYNVTLVITDEFGRERNITNTISVELLPLVAGFTYELDGMVATFTANETSPGLVIDHYLWRFEAVGWTIYGNRQVTHEFTKAGDYEVSLTLYDEYGRHDGYSLIVKVKEEESTDDGIFENMTLILILIGIILAIAMIVIVLSSRGKGEE